MSKNKGFSNTSAQRYSLALYELSSEADSLKVVEQHVLAILKLIQTSKDFYNLIKDPTENQENFILVINKISENFRIDNLLKNFMIFLIKKRRFFYLEKILIDFLEVCSKSRGEIKAELSSAKELSETDISNIKEELSQNFGANIKLNYKYDPNLIGGLVLKVGSTMVDNSIKNKLQQIQKQMIEA